MIAKATDVVCTNAWGDAVQQCDFLFFNPHNVSTLMFTNIRNVERNVGNTYHLKAHLLRIFISTITYLLKGICGFLLCVVE